MLIPQELLLEAGQEKASQVTTYSSQLLITRPQMCLVPRVRPAAHEDLVPPVDPALRRSLTQVDLLSLVPTCVRVEVDSEKSVRGAIGTRQERRGKR